jgi:CelD/BcsL family acetyltransferase involved in cellulose biosynthesis
MQNDNTPRSDIIALQEKESEVLNAVIRYLKTQQTWDIIRLRNLSHASLSYPLLQQALKESQLPFGVQQGFRSPFIEIRSDWKEYYDSKSHKFRKVMRNKVNRIQRLGSFTVQKIEDGDHALALMPAICDISRKSWKGNCHGDIARSDDNRLFFEHISRAAGVKGWLNLWLLSIDQRPVAYEYHLKYNNRLFAMRSDFDEEFRDYSPGSFLEAQVIRKAFEDRIAELDLCGNDYPYKLRWTEAVREHFTFEIFSDSLRSRFAYAAEYRALTLLRNIKHRLWRDAIQH